MNLPTELIWNILENCPYASLCCLSETCSQMHAIISDPGMVRVLCDTRNISEQSDIHMMKRETSSKKVNDLLEQYGLGTIDTQRIVTESLFDGVIRVIYLKLRSRELIYELQRILRHMLFMTFPINVKTNILKFIGFTMSRHLLQSHDGKMYRKYLLRFIRYAPFNAPVIYKNLLQTDILDLKDYWDKMNHEYVSQYNQINLNELMDHK